MERRKHKITLAKKKNKINTSWRHEGVRLQSFRPSRCAHALKETKREQGHTLER